MIDQRPRAIHRHPHGAGDLVALFVAVSFLLASIYAWFSAAG